MFMNMWLVVGAELFSLFVNADDKTSTYTRTAPRQELMFHLSGQLCFETKVVLTVWAGKLIRTVSES